MLREAGAALPLAARASRARSNRPERISARKVMIAWPPSMLHRMPEPLNLLVTMLLFAASTTPLQIGRSRSFRARQRMRDPFLRKNSGSRSTSARPRLHPSCRQRMARTARSPRRARSSAPRAASGARRPDYARTARRHEDARSRAMRREPPHGDPASQGSPGSTAPRRPPPPAPGPAADPGSARPPPSAAPSGRTCPPPACAPGKRRQCASPPCRGRRPSRRRPRAGMPPASRTCAIAASSASLQRS